VPTSEEQVSSLPREPEPILSTPIVSITTRPVYPEDIEGLLPDLVELLRDSVDSGASLGFLPPLSSDEARSYWRSLRGELGAGSRLLLGVSADGRIVGTGQLLFSPWTNSRHRAELQKLFVSSEVRGRGIGRALMLALHSAARERGRSLLILNTRRGESTEDFYKSLGYREVGVTPGYTFGPAGERYDNITLYQELSP
jgi:GNAT superfamily N-acetyltransferase